MQTVASDVEPGVDEARYARQWDDEEEEAPLLEIPEPDVAAIEVGPSDDWVPKSARATLARALKAGWRARLCYSVGPRISSRKILEDHCWTVSVAAAAPDGRRLAYFWQLTGSGWKLEHTRDADTAAPLTFKEANERLTT